MCDDRQRLRINDTSGEPVAIVLPDLPERIRCKLRPRLNTAFPCYLVYTDSKDDEHTTFDSVHCVWWARYLASVSIQECSYYIRCLMIDLGTGIYPNY